MQMQKVLEELFASVHIPFANVQCQEKEQLGYTHNKKPPTRGWAGPGKRIQYLWDQQGSMEILSAGPLHTACSYVEYEAL